MTLVIPHYIPPKKASVPKDPPCDLDKDSLKETIKGVAAVMNSEWLFPLLIFQKRTVVS
jgi:hypothetical protein